jgi:hypothetical protein
VAGLLGFALAVGRRDGQILRFIVAAGRATPDLFECRAQTLTAWCPDLPIDLEPTYFTPVADLDTSTPA